MVGTSMLLQVRLFIWYWAMLGIMDVMPKWSNSATALFLVDSTAVVVAGGDLDYQDVRLNIVMFLSRVASMPSCA